MKGAFKLGMMVSVVTGLAGMGCATQGEAGGEVSFTRDVKPILERRCLPCHSGALMPGMLNLSSREAFEASRPGGGMIVAGDPEGSRLIHKMSLEGDETGAMPPTGHALSAEEQRVLTEWIREGASWPEGRAGWMRAKPGAEPRSI